MTGPFRPFTRGSGSAGVATTIEGRSTRKEWPALSAEPVRPVHPADAAATAPYEVIHLGGQAPVIVPFADVLRLRALESAASAQALENAEDAAAV